MHNRRLSAAAGTAEPARASVLTKQTPAHNITTNVFRLPSVKWGFHALLKCVHGVARARVDASARILLHHYAVEDEPDAQRHHQDDQRAAHGDEHVEPPLKHNAASRRRRRRGSRRGGRRLGCTRRRRSNIRCAYHYTTLC